MIDILSKFTYEAYTELLNHLQTKYKIIPVRELPHAQEPYLVLTHGVDLSIKSAAVMASIEHSLGISSTYFILLSGKLYNPAEKDNLKHLNTIIDLGHEIGLHYDLKAYNEARASPSRMLLREAGILEALTGQRITSICMHQPAWEDSDPFLDHYLYRNIAKPSQYDLYVVESYRAWGMEYVDKLLSFDYDRVRLSTHPGLWFEKEYTREKAIKRIVDLVDVDNRSEWLYNLVGNHWANHPKVLEYEKYLKS